jgi:hypothetical protein
LATTEIAVEPASRLFSSISFSADDGRWITSPAAILFTTPSSSFLISGAGAAIGCSPAASSSDLYFKYACSKMVQ